MGRTVKKMLCCLIVASTVRTHGRLLSFDTVMISGLEWAVARCQLGDGDALASGPAKSPVKLRTGVSRESVVAG